MCQYHSKFNGFINELNEQRALLIAQVSRLDKKISNLYHDLEGVEPTEEFALGFVTQLHDTLRKRRVIKDEMARLDVVLRPVSSIVGDIETSVKQRKAVSKRWQKDFKMTLTLEDVVSGN